MQQHWRNMRTHKKQIACKRPAQLQEKAQSKGQEERLMQQQLQQKQALCWFSELSKPSQRLQQSTPAA
jgi:hypothetical protein